MLIRSGPTSFTTLAFAAAFFVTLSPGPFIGAQSITSVPQIPEAAQSRSEATPGSDLTIRGVVLSTVDQKPIPDALVTTFPGRGTVLTDGQGRFMLSGLRPGAVTAISVKKAGYLCSPLSHARPRPHCYESIQARPAGLVIMTLMPEAIITGRIVTESSRPIEGIPVSLFERSIKDGRYIWNPADAPLAKTDADGMFRALGLEPGTYLLRTPAAAIVRVPFGEDLGFEATWYPGSSTQQQAEPIVLAAGKQFTANLAVKQSLALVNIPFEWNRADEVGSTVYGLSAGEPGDSLKTSLFTKTHLFQAYAPYGHYSFTMCVSPIANPPASGSWSDGTKAPFCGVEEFTITDKTISAPTIPLQ